MKRLLLILACSSVLFGQSFPSSVYTPLVAKDNVQTQLTVAMGIGDTNVVVASTTGWEANMVAYICDTTTVTNSVARCSGTFEVMLVTAVPSATTLTVTRAYGGTTAKAHSNGKGFSNSPAAIYTNSSQIELQGITRVLGINAGNIVTTFNAQAYYWSPMTPGGSIGAGSNAVTLTPCPSGISATSIGIGSAYISGGTGTAEGVPITGYTSGTGNCIITITAANTHTGAWTIGPSANGIVEAITAASAAGGGTVVASIGTTTVYHRIVLPSNVILQGQGVSSVLKLPDNSWPASFAGPFLCNSGNYICLITSVTGASFVEIGNFKLDMNGANNANTINGADIFLKGCLDCRVHDVVAIHSHHTGGFGFSVDDSGTTKNNAWDHNTIHGYGSANSGGLPTCGGGIFVQGSGGRITNNYADNLCDAAFIANGGNGIVISHNYWKQSGSAVLLGNVFSSETSNYTVMTDNVCDGESNIGCYVIGWVAGVAGSIGGVIANNECYGGTTFACAAVISDTGYTVKNVTISGNRFTRGIAVGLFSGTGATGISNITISGNTINDCPGVGVFVSYGANHVNIGDNTITGCLINYAIDVATANTSDIYIHDNLLNGNAGDILDASNVATICRNHTDSTWNGQCNLINANYRAATLVNGANQNVSTVPTLPAAAVAANTVADIQIEVVGPTGAFSIGGFATPSAGRMIRLNNTTAQTMTLTNEAAGSTAANRIFTPTGADITAKVAILMYSPGQARWIVHSYQ